MRNVKLWLFATFVAGALAGMALPYITTTSEAAAAEKAVLKSHWRHHDGHWSYWDDGDKRWYYTDGANWYYNDNDAWKLYPFDRTFGREGESFVREEYKVPGPDVKVVVPRHKVFHIK